jgi:hypothetical protein
MVDTKKRYYYHVTQENWGKRIKLSPRTWGDNRADEEPEDSRICVSTSIEGCLVALCGCLAGGGIAYVYRTVSQVKAVKPYNVVDSRITGERWLIRATTFEKYGRVIKKQLPKSMLEISVGDSGMLTDQRKFKRKLVNNKNWFLRY